MVEILPKDSKNKKVDEFIKKAIHDKTHFDESALTQWTNLIGQCRKLRHLAQNAKKSKEGKVKTMLNKDGKENIDKKLTKFKKVLNEAMLLAVHNVPPVPGTSIFFVRKTTRPSKPGAKGVGSDPNIQVIIIN